MQVGLTNTSTTQTVHFSGVYSDCSVHRDDGLHDAGAGGNVSRIDRFQADERLCQNRGTRIVTVNDDDPGGNFVITING